MERPREKCDSKRALCQSMDMILGSSAAIRHRMGHRVMQPPTVGFASIPGLLKLAEKNKEKLNLMTVDFVGAVPVVTLKVLFLVSTGTPNRERKKKKQG